MTIVEWTDYTLAPTGNGNGLRGCFLKLSPGDVCAIEADFQDDGLCLLQALATLISPLSGNYRFKGEDLNFCDYRNLLPWKKRIGYISRHSAMISNRTIRENLLLMRYYSENSLLIDLDDNTLNLCRAFELEDKLGLRPGVLDPSDLQCAIMIRELAKSPEVLLMDRPEDFVGHSNFGKVMDALKKLLSRNIAMVMLSHSEHFIEALANKKITIADARLTTEPFGPNRSLPSMGSCHGTSF